MSGLYERRKGLPVRLSIMVCVCVYIYIKVLLSSYIQTCSENSFWRRKFRGWVNPLGLKCRCYRDVWIKKKLILLYPLVKKSVKLYCHLIYIHMALELYATIHERVITSFLEKWYTVMTLPKLKPTSTQTQINMYVYNFPKWKQKFQ